MYFHSLQLLAIMILLVGCADDNSTVKKDAKTTSESSQVRPSSPSNDSSVQTIVFLGTSLTAGYGINESEAYPARIQQKLDSAGLPFTTLNAGVSGATSAEGLRRVDWLLRQEMDVLFIELGANDGLRGNDARQTIRDLKANLTGIIIKARAAHPDVSIIVAGMTLPPNFGREFIADFEAVFAEVATEQKVVFLPFLLKGVGGVPELNQNDGIHPTAEGQQIISQTVWEALLPVLQARLSAS